METTKIIEFFYEPTATGYSGFAPAYSIVATGSTLEKLKEDAQDGLNYQCEYLKEDSKQYQFIFKPL
jgi:hypothetical protein